MTRNATNAFFRVVDAVNCSTALQEKAPHTEEVDSLKRHCTKIRRDQTRSDMQWSWISILLVVLATTSESEWIQISQEHSDKNGIRDLALDHSAILENIYTKKDLNNLKYEDLDDVIGAGFENDFLKFLENHRSELNQTSSELLAYDGSPFGSDTDDKTPNSSNESEITSETILEVVSQNENSSEDGRKFNHSVKHETALNPFSTENERKSFILKNVNNVNSVKSVSGKIVHLSDLDAFHNVTHESNDQKNYNKTAKTKKIILKMLKIQPPPQPSFSDILKYLKEIQQSFMVKAAGGIQDKIKTLENFRDELMANIGK